MSGYNYFGGSDDGVIMSDPGKVGSDIFLVANGTIIFEFDKNNNNDGGFEIKDGSGTTKFKVLKNGTIEVAGKIQYLTDPVSAQDAATKAYVDANTSSPTYIVGLSAEQGGYIFWVSADGKHGLVAETVDQPSSSNWYEAHDFISNPSNHSADGDDFRDWRLPTRYELNKMYLQKDDIGGFSSDSYWSSTEYDDVNAWRQFFSNGEQSYNSKYGLSNVRAVRAF